MLTNELQLGSLHTVKIIAPKKNGHLGTLDLVRPILMLIHKERFQGRISLAFSQLLVNSIYQRQVGEEQSV